MNIQRHQPHRHHHGRREHRTPYEDDDDSDQEEKFDSYGIILNQYGKEMDDLTKKEQSLRKESVEHFRKKDEIVKNAQADAEAAAAASNVNFSKEEQKLMEQYGSAAVTDPELRAQFEKQKEQMLEQQKKFQQQKEKATQDQHAAKEHEYNVQLKQIYESKRRLQRDRKDYPDLSILFEWAEWNGEQQYMVILRKFNIGHRKRRVQSLMKSIMNFAQGKRSRVTIRENRNITWQGILGLVFGMFSFLLCVLIGQFVDPEPRRSLRSPPGNNANYANSIRRRHVNHLNAQGPPMVPKTFKSSSNRQSSAPMRQKAYGGYVPSKSTY